MNKQIKKIVKKSGPSFFWSMHILPVGQRRAMYTLYAFCRHIDNIVDGAEPLSVKMELIDAWRRELNNIYDKKTPASDIGRNIYKNCMRFNLPQQELTALLNSMAMDLPFPLQAPSLDKFNRYCYGVACAPGSMTLRILGCQDEQRITAVASSLGMAMQITNILRDIRDDAMIGRLYIPCEILQKAGITSTDPMTVLVDKNLAVAREELARIALKNFDAAFAAIPELDAKIARHIKAAAYIYKRYFEIMQNRGWEVISPKPKINRLSKLLLVLKAFSGR